MIDKKKDLTNFSRHFLLSYFGFLDDISQTKRVEELNECLRYCNIDATFELNPEDNEQVYIQGPDAYKAAYLQTSLEKCWPLGRFERELASVEGVIMKNTQPYLRFICNKIKYSIIRYTNKIQLRIFGKIIF